MKKMNLRVISVLLALSLCFTGMVSGSITAHADSQRVITLGADLTEEQKKSVLDYFKVTDESIKTMDIITITNEDERAVLTGIAPESAIGHKTYSCAYIEPTMSGGISVKTNNLTYVTVNSLYNALQTAGIENCNLVVTAPFAVSGTGALTGVFKAFESTGNVLDEEKKEAATEELMLGSKIESDYGEEGLEVVSVLKGKIVSSEEELTDEDIKKLVEEELNNRGLNFSEEDTDALNELLGKLKGLKYDKDSFSNKLNELADKVNDVDKESAWGYIKNFFKSIGDFFADLFGSGNNDGDMEDTEVESQESTEEDADEGESTGLEDTESSEDSESESEGIEENSSTEEVEE